MPDAPTRAQLISFLTDSDSYPHQPDQIDLIETHISLVALAGERVYKVKKPVNLQFVDYRDLADRRSYCEDEVELNRRLCDDTYVGVRSVGWMDGKLSFDAEPPVEYAVEMNRLTSEDLLDQRIDRGDIIASDLDPLIQKLATFINDQKPNPETAAWGWPEKIRASLDENLLQTGGHVGHFLSQPAYDTLAYFFGRFLDHQYALLAERRARGAFINGHGDLRLEHVHLSNSDVCIFDCIEFSERLRYLDVASELAFLCMEFDLVDRPDLKAYFLNNISNAVERTLPLDLLTFYASYRAHVRAKVEGMQSLDQEREKSDRKQHEELACRRYQQALRYAVAGNGPLILIVMGPPATGKSTVAQEVADVLGWPLHSSDRIRKEQAGLDPEERPDKETRNQLYARERSEKVYRELMERALDRAEERMGVVLDATFSSREGRAEFRDAFRSRDISYAFLELLAPHDMLKARLRQRARTGSVSDARLEDFEMLIDRYETPDALEDARHLRLSATGTIEETVSLALKRLVQLQW